MTVPSMFTLDFCGGMLSVRNCNLLLG